MSNADGTVLIVGDRLDFREKERLDWSCALAVDETVHSLRFDVQPTAME
jgi:hypothetical protein